MKFVIVGGVTGGAGTAARLEGWMKTRRLLCLKKALMYPILTAASPTA